MRNQRVSLAILFVVGIMIVVLRNLDLRVPYSSRLEQKGRTIPDFFEKQLQLSSRTDRPSNYVISTKDHHEKRKISTTPSPPYDILKTQDQRHRSVMDTCILYGGDPNDVESRNLTENQLWMLSHVYVIPKFKILYCAIPKAGCTNWKQMILNISGYGDILEDMKESSGAYSVHDLMNHAYKPISKLDPDRARETLKTYKSFMFVRNPYSRLLSAYQDKILQDEHSKWRDEMLEWIISNDPKVAADVFLGKRNFTFEEFLTFYLSPIDNNPHWKEYYRLCFPCLVNYDFIGKLETMREDSKYILETLFQVNSSLSLSKSKRVTDSSSYGSLRDLYSSIPRDLLRRISVYGGLTIDSKLFGYDIPKAIKELLQ
ncbi:carbohydrate sulfotransferase 11-like [Lytechinus pictus]|uniref:carbohydrate sulfotransferase 11-like n=1 Tax=Lytechinus pictus TaxID=7653 RepID=UPI0030B9FF87